jgi:glycosyltransferase involved in cell wall biosynthesis
MTGAEFPAMVSVVVPTRNRAAKLRVCLRGLLTQDYPADRYEVVVVDDGSADNTRAVVDLAGGGDAHPRVRYVHQPHRGVSAARNAGARAAAGDPVAFTDDDTEAPPSWLRALVEGVGRHPEAEGFGGPVWLRCEGRAPRTCGRERLASELDLGPSDLATPHVLGANLAARRSALRLGGGFDERIVIGGEDAEWTTRLQRAGGRVVYLADAGLWHRRTADDLRLRRLLRERFVRAASFHRYIAATDDSASVLRSLRPVPRALGHALRARCAGGLLLAATWAGYAYGLTVHERGGRPGC